MNASLWRMTLRYLWRRPWQTGLCILGVALGVAVMVAIDLANTSASRAFTLSTDAIAGKATHQIIAGSQGLDEDLYRRLRTELGVTQAAPVVEGYVTALDLDRMPLHILGIDPFAESPFRSYVSGGSALPFQQLVQFFSQPGAILISQPMAERYHLTTGSLINVRLDSGRKELKVVGLLNPSDEVSQRALDGLVLADVSTAQEVLGDVGRLSHIDLILDTSTPAGQAQLQAIEARLPPAGHVVRPQTRSQAVEQIASAFELNLTAMSLLALVVGMFLIYNTITFSVVQRRSVLGILRCLGATRGQIFGLILLEAAGVGATGALLGLALGILLGRGAVGLVTQTINDLYFVVSVRSLDLDPFSLAKGLLAGIAASLAAASVPAWEATHVPPAGALRRSLIESSVRKMLPGTVVAGLGVGLLGALVLRIPTRSLVISFGGNLLVIVAFAILAPSVTVFLMQLLAPLTGRFFGVLGRMAPRDIVASLSRTSVAIAALTIAVSVTIGVGVMVSSFRSTVENWLGSTLVADIYVSPPGIAPNRPDASVDPAVASELAAIPGVQSVEAYRNTSVDSPEGSVTIVAINAQHDRSARLYASSNVPAADVWPALRQGAVMVSEPYANRHQIPAQGGMVTLYTDQGPHTFPIIAIFYDYGSDQGVVMMALNTYQAYWSDRMISSAAVYVAPGQNVDTVVQRMRFGFAGKRELVIQANSSLRESVLKVFDRAFAITGALQVLATLVAFVGVLSALLSLQLERAHDLAILRAAGMSRRQLLGYTLLQTGLMGATAGVLAAPTGLALAIVLIYVINLRSFGWTIQMQVQPSFFLQAFFVALGAALLAGVYPALRLGHMQTAEALREG